MKYKWFAFLIIPVVILSLFSGLVLPANAQGVATATPTPAAQATPVATDPNAVSFFQINPSEIQLNGPFDSTSFSFGLPANWRLIGNATLELRMAVSFNTAVKPGADAANVFALQGGTLTVRINGTAVGVLPLNQVGEITQTITIPADALVSQRPDGRLEVSFVLNSGISCYVSQQMTIFIHTSSRFLLPHDEAMPEATLLKFPQPLYQGSVFPETALIVIPDNPSSAELRAALTVAAGLGSLTGNSIALDLTTVGKLTAEQQLANNLVMVGKAASLPLLSNVTLPLPVSGNQFKFVGDAVDNGVIQLANSPWSLPKVVLVVSGNTDAGVVKAAQAVTTGFLRTNTAPNLSIVEQVQSNPVKVSTPIDQSLAELALADAGIVAAPGQALKTLRYAGSNTASYRFYIPPGQTVTPDAFFDLVFGHSALLNYARSGLVISINGQPIGSVRMSDVTAANATNHTQITIPATVLLPGYNRLEIRSNLIPNDACVDPQLDGLWATIWPDSNLHLPLAPSQVNQLSAVDLSTYPAPFSFQPTLGDTAFVLAHDDLESWRAASRIAAFLGDRTNGALYTFNAFYGDELKDPDRAKYNLVVIGLPSKLPIVADMNTSLPAPFDPSSDVAIESNMQVKFNIPASTPTGYVQLFASPWNPQNLVIAALGNSQQGVLWAASALVDAPLRTRLAGNFAAISGTQVVTTDTRLTAFQQGTDTTPASALPISVSKVDLTTPAANRPIWIMPAIYVALGLMGLVLLIALIGAFVRSRRS